MAIRPPAPDILWHYTDANGLYGIVESRQFRFGDVHFLNDRTERVYGTQTLEQVFTEEIAADDSDGHLTQLRKHIQASRTSERLFACSFSATKESISQWQRYGADGGGYCLGFDANALDDLFDQDALRRVPMLYRQSEQKEYLREKIRRAVEHYRQKAAAAAGDERHAIGVYDIMFTAGDVDDATLRLKNPFFEDEQEWRYFERVEEDELEDDDVDQEFAVRGSYVKPFLRFPRRRKKKPLAPLPLVSVVCGPKLEGGIAVPTVRRFLRSQGYDTVSVEWSALASIWR